MSLHCYNRDKKADIQHSKIKSLLHATFYSMSTLLPDILILPLPPTSKRGYREKYL